MMLLIGLLWFVSCGIVGIMAENRGRSGLFWLVLSILFSPILTSFALLIIQPKPIKRKNGV